MAKQPSNLKGKGNPLNRIDSLKLIFTALCIAFGAVVMSTYFQPAFEKQNVLNQPDIKRVKGMLNETVNHTKQYGEEALWTSRMFGGMPTYQIHNDHPNNFLTKLHQVFMLGLPHPVGWFFLLFLGMFVLLMSMRLDPWTATVGAIAYSFGTYFMVAMEAGHNSKLTALGYAPAVFGGIIMTYRGRYFLGGAIFALALGMQLMANHFQITFYLLFAIIALVISEIARSVKTTYALGLLGLLFVPIIWMVDPCNDLQMLWIGVALLSLVTPLVLQLVTEIPKGGWKSPGFAKAKNFIIASLILIAGGLLAVGPNLGRLYTTAEYKTDTMRGGVILEEENHCKGGQARAVDPNVDIGDCPNSSGLKKSYAYGWSYGVAESFTLINPFYMGDASSAKLGEDSDTYNVLAGTFGPQGADQLTKQWPLYFGDQPGTSGPVYIGAVVFFLFILGMLTVSNRYRWWLLGATVLSILLSWGKNWQPFSDLFFDHFPLYNNFRAVSMTLIIAGITMPVLAALALHKFLNSKDTPRKVIERNLMIAAGASVSLLLVLLAVKPGIDSFGKITDDARLGGLLQQIGVGENLSLKNSLLSALVEDRASMFQFGMLRSIGLILLAAGAMFGYLRFIKPRFAKSKPVYGSIILSAVLTLVVMLDLIPINRRYIDDDSFITKQEFLKQYQITSLDNELFADPDPNFRVIRIGGGRNPWTDSFTSYHHKNVGGYHAAKFRRYNDLIDCHLDAEQNAIMQGLAAGTQAQAFENAHAMNMMNLKYALVMSNQGEVKVENTSRYGAAWVVNDFVIKETNVDEIDAISQVNPRTTAIIHKEFQDDLSGFTPAPDAQATVQVTKFLPNHITYQFNAPSGKEQLVVFSEIYYRKGWNLYIDGAKEVSPHFRADYVLRAARIPGGNHTLEFKFEPESYQIGESVGLIGSILMLLVFAGIGYLAFRDKLKAETDPQI